MAKGPLMPNLSLKDLKKIQEGFRQLLAVVEDGQTPPSKHCGICFNTSKLLVMSGQSSFLGIPIIGLVAYFSINWPHTADLEEGCMYPVPNDPRYGLWEGPNYTMRVSLLRYCIKRIRDIIRRRGRAQA